MKPGAFLILSAAVFFTAASYESEACTGITLVSKDSSHVLARTCEWGGSFLQSRYVVVPRGYAQTALTPAGANGLEFTSKYGYAGNVDEMLARLEYDMIYYENMSLKLDLMILLDTVRTVATGKGI